jgi:metabolite-proton symporter
MTSPPGPAPSEDRRARRATVAATIGTAIEWYDFYVYALASTLVFPQLFFPSSDPLAGTMLALSTFLVGFVVRPVGAAIFGHFGDRIGRKSTLVATLLLMGVGTALVGVVPTYDAIGIWGALALVVLRVVQGLGVGGEWGGAVLMSTEWKDANGRRGLRGSWPQFGSPLGLLMASGSIAAVQAELSEEAFLSWGWRLPFLASIVLIAVGLVIRLGVAESTAFRDVRSKDEVQRVPLATALRGHWRAILATCFMRAAQTGPFYIFATFVITYGSEQLGMDSGFLVNAVLVGAAVSLLSTPFWGWLSDRVGRRRLHLLGTVVMFVFALPYFGLLDTGLEWAVVVATVLGLVIHDMQYAPQASLLTDSFPPEVRYTASSLAYQLGSVLWAGPAALIATALLQATGTSVAVAAYIMALAVVGFVATLLVHDRQTAHAGRPAERDLVEEAA